MMASQALALLLASASAIMVSSGKINIWLVFAIAALRGTMMSFNLPARESLVSDLEPRGSLANAIALNAATLNLTRVIGPLIAGLLVGAIGVAGCFYVNVRSFLPVLWALHAMRLFRAAVASMATVLVLPGVSSLLASPRLRGLR